MIIGPWQLLYELNSYWCPISLGCGPSRLDPHFFFLLDTALRAVMTRVIRKVHGTLGVAPRTMLVCDILKDTSWTHPWGLARTPPVLSWPRSIVRQDRLPVSDKRMARAVLMQHFTFVWTLLVFVVLQRRFPGRRVEEEEKKRSTVSPSGVGVTLTWSMGAGCCLAQSRRAIFFWNPANVVPTLVHCCRARTS